MNKKMFFRIVSVALVLITFLYPSLLTANEPQDKLAAYSRFQKYFEARDESGRKKNDLILPESFTTAIPAFVNAMAELNRAVNANKADSDINAIIQRHNTGLSELAGLTLGNIRERTVNTRKGTKTFKSIKLTFKNGQRRDVVFINKEREPEVLTALGITKDEDRRYLKVPGVEGLWITKEDTKEDTIDIAAGGEGVSSEANGEMSEAISGIFNIILADIREMLTTSNQTGILLTQDDSSPEVQSVRGQIQNRLCEIETAIRWTIACYLEPEIVYKCMCLTLRRGQEIDVEKIEASVRGGQDYYKNPSLLFQSRESGVLLLQEGVLPINIELDILVQSFLRSHCNKVVSSLTDRLVGELTDERGGYCIDKYMGQDTRMYVSNQVIDTTELGQLFNGSRGGLSEQVIDRLRSEKANRIIRVATSDRLDERKQNILGRITALASVCGFGENVKLVGEKDVKGRIVAVRLTRQFRSEPAGPMPKSVRRYAVNENQLVYYPGALERMVTLARIFDDDTLETRDWGTDNSFVTTLLRNIVTAESARLTHAAEYLNGLNIEAGDKGDGKENEATKRVSLVSYLAMITQTGKLPCKISELNEARVRSLAEGQLRGDWVDVLAQYIWFSNIFSDNYDNLYQTFRYTEEEITRRVTEVLNKQLPDVDTEGRTALAGLIAPKVWGIHSQFVLIAKDKIRSAFGVESGEYVDIAAGGERGDGKEHTVILIDSRWRREDAERRFSEALGRDRLVEAFRRDADAVLQGIKSADQIVIDCKQWKLMLTYARNPETGQIEEKDRIALSRIEPTLGFIGLFQEHKLQLVFTSVINTDWVETMVRAKRVIESNLAAVKTPNSIIRGEGVILMVDADGIIYVMPETGARPDVLPSLGQRVQATLALQNAVARSERAGQKGFIDLDARLFQIKNLDFQELLYNRLQEVYNEGLVVRVARVAGQIEEQIPHEKIRSILNMFDQRANSAEWSGVESTKVNTVTIVSSDNTQLASKREGTSTVIRLEFNPQLNLPQLSPAILIARAIISVGGEQNVTGSLLEDIRNLYLNMVPKELQGQVQEATSISELLAIILLPISAEDLRIYEYLLIGKKVAEIAA